VQQLRVNPFFDEVDERDVGLEVHAARPLSETVGKTEPKPFGTGEVTLLGQVWGRYLAAVSAEGLLLIDQHRAAERVLFEKLQEQSEGVTAQLLALPQSLELPGPEYAALAENREALAGLGYQLEEFGGNTLLVRAVPAAAYRDPLAALRDLAADLAESGLPGDWNLARQELLARVACHAAITAGQRLTGVEAQALLENLLATQAPAVCPHGDPVVVHIPLHQIDRRFKR